MLLPLNLPVLYREPIVRLHTSPPIPFSGGGIWAILPILYPFADIWLHLHYLWITVLLFNVYFNMAMSASTQAGKVPPKKWGHLSLVAAGGLESFTFCESCKRPKPPSAHHCRQCGECVLEMDHHCPFVSGRYLFHGPFDVIEANEISPQGWVQPIKPLVCKNRKEKKPIG